MRTLAICGVLIACAAVSLPAAVQDSPTYRSDTRLVRVDTQVIDASGRAVTGLRISDFKLLENGKRRRILNFLTEDLPADVLLLLDVSGSMRPKIELVSRASNEALRVLAPGDRVAIMTFDRSTKVRLPFRGSRSDVTQELNALLSRERFNGGTDIFRGMVDAIRYVEQNAREEARKAIIIVTDDRTGGHRDDAAIVAELAEADIVMSALLAPDAMMSYGGQGGGGVGLPPTTRWPGRSPSVIDILLGGGRYPRSRGPIPSPQPGGDVMMSGGTAEISRASGGDSMNVQDAYALRETLERIRQRYALHFNLPATARPSELRRLDVELSMNAMRRYPGADLRYRRVYRTPRDLKEPGPDARDEEELTDASEQEELTTTATPPPVAPERQGSPQRTVVDETERLRGPLPAVRAPGASQNGETRRAEPVPNEPKPGWRTATEAEKREIKQLEEEAGKSSDGTNPASSKSKKK